MSEQTNNLNEFKPFNEDTLEDALVPIRERFGEGACELARKHLRNPLKAKCDDLGTVGYRKGKPVCFQAACVRRLYWKQQEIYGIVGGLTCRTHKGCPPSVTFETIERAQAPRLGSVMSFGNSCCRETAIMDEGTGGIAGPESCACYYLGVVRPLKGLAYFIRRKMLKMGMPDWPVFSTLESSDFSMTISGLRISRLMSVEPAFFDTLMSRYVETNRGLVCSRTAAEYEWMYGDRIRSGRYVLLGAYCEENPVGLIMIDGCEQGVRWSLEDWFALDNDRRLLETLLKAAFRYLRRATPAMAFESTCFSSYAASLLKRYMPKKRSVGCQQFFWSAEAELQKEMMPVIDTQDSWFFCPYDGDRNM